MSKNTEVLFSKGPYDVKVENGEYVVLNRNTLVIEHKTPVLYEAIRLAKSFDTLLLDAVTEVNERKKPFEIPNKTLN